MVMVVLCVWTVCRYVGRREPRHTERPRHDRVTTASWPRRDRVTTASHWTTASRPRHDRVTPASWPRHDRVTTASHWTTASRPRHDRVTTASHWTSAAFDTRRTKRRSRRFQQLVYQDSLKPWPTTTLFSMNISSTDIPVFLLRYVKLVKA